MGLPAVGGGSSWSAETEMPAVGGILVSAGRGGGEGVTGLQVWLDAPPRRATIGRHHGSSRRVISVDVNSPQKDMDAARQNRAPAEGTVDQRWEPLPQ